jgi:hypothetical protein
MAALRGGAARMLRHARGGLCSSALQRTSLPGQVTFTRIGFHMLARS